MAGTVQKGQWCVYALECADGSLYVGVTNDLDQRIKTHLAGKGSKYVKTRRPAELFGAIPYPDKATAMKEEYRIKTTLTREQKLRLFARAKPAETAPDQGDAGVDMCLTC